VPVPAVLEMLSGSGIPVVTEDIECELATPTGVGLVKTFAKSFGPMPRMRIEKTGYGFGKRDTGRLNALRTLLGEPAADAATAYATDNTADAANTASAYATDNTADAANTDHVTLLEANIDDMTAETLGYAMECLLEAGALDAYFTPIHMKKNRPAVILSAISRPEDAPGLTDLIFRETATLGVRIMDVARAVMDRRVETVNVGTYGEIRCKVAERKGVTRVSPEYEDCRAYAKSAGIPLADAFDIVRSEYSKISKKKQTRENVNKSE
jgi:uncharacterized protein (TIGR00299 family) protein